jgi:hypothetical protein
MESYIAAWLVGSSLDFELVSDWSSRRSSLETKVIAIDQFLSIWHRTKSISTGGLSNLLSLGRQHISSCDVVGREIEKTYPENWQLQWLKTSRKASAFRV